VSASELLWTDTYSHTHVNCSEYIRITHDYPLAAAKSFSTLSNSGKFNFVYVSGEG
jgi:hypothetical protein